MKTEMVNGILPLEYDKYVFDLYGTLVDIRTHEDDPVLWQNLAIFMGYYDAVYTPEDLEDAYLKLVKRREDELEKKLMEQQGKEGAYCRKKDDLHEAHPEIEIAGVFEELYQAKGVSAEESLVRHTAQFFRAVSTEYLRLYPGTVEMLKYLRQAGKKIYLLSNAQRIFTEYEMNALQITPYFDGILISSDFGVKKPDLAFYEQLFLQFGVTADRTIMVGNDSKADIVGGKQAGFATYYVKSSISPEGDCAPMADYQVPRFETWDLPRDSK